MKISYKAVSFFSGAASLLSPFIYTIFVVVSSPTSGSKTLIGYTLKDIIRLFSDGDFAKFTSNLLSNSDYSNFKPNFLTALIFLIIAIISAAAIIVSSLISKHYTTNIFLSLAGFASLVISAMGISAISSQVSSMNIDFLKVKLDIFYDFLNLKAINCGGTYFIMGFFFCVVLLISGAFAIFYRENKKQKGVKQ